MPLSIAQITSTSGHQTIVLPEGFQMEGTQVSVRRRGNALILEPIADNWEWLEKVSGQLDPEVLEAVQSANSSDQFDHTSPPDLDGI
jgi:antitoxin VapB